MRARLALLSPCRLAYAIAHAVGYLGYEVLRGYHDGQLSRMQARAGIRD